MQYLRVVYMYLRLCQYHSNTRKGFRVDYYNKVLYVTMEHINVDFRGQANDAGDKSNDDVIDIVHDKHSIKVPAGESQKICLRRAGGTGYEHSWPDRDDGIEILQIDEWKPLASFEHKCVGPVTLVLEIKVDATTPARTVQVPIYLTRSEPCEDDAPEHIIDVQVVNAKHVEDGKVVKKFGEDTDGAGEKRKLRCDESSEDDGGGGAAVAKKKRRLRCDESSEEDE